LNKKAPPSESKKG